jgi:hypothetical protein
MIPYVEFLLKYGPQMVEGIMKAIKVAKKESVGKCYCCGADVYVELGTMLSIDLIEDLLELRAISCDKKECKAFVEIKNLGAKNEYFK